MLVLTTLVAPARAWETGNAGPFSFLFHHYGDDMYQPPITPDRPYWHGDDAVPPDLRWHDREIEVVDEYGFTVGTRVSEPVIAAGVEVRTIEVSARHRARRHVAVPRRRPTRLARAACPPLPPAPMPARPVVPPVPAPTEH